MVAQSDGTHAVHFNFFSGESQNSQFSINNVEILNIFFRAISGEYAIKKGCFTVILLSSNVG